MFFVELLMTMMPDSGILFYDGADALSAAIIVFPSLILSIGLTLHSGLQCTVTNTFALFLLFFQQKITLVQY